jgi:hypothetical protein
VPEFVTGRVVLVLVKAASVDTVCVADSGEMPPKPRYRGWDDEPPHYGIP